LRQGGGDGEVEKLLSLGIDCGQRWSGKIVKTVMVTDPDDNHIAFAEPVNADIAR
jgi:hypothetical protein